MTKPSSVLLLFLPLLIASCVTTVGDAGEAPDPPPEPTTETQACNDPRYEDGVCNLDLTCEEPDIDCYKTFADDTLASTWFAEREANRARDDGRPVRTLLAPTDPRFLQMRAQLDAGWQAFRKTRPVGKLGELKPALVMFEDTSANASVCAESSTKLQVFAVMVNTGLQTAPLASDARLGILLHELQHLAGTHSIPGVKDVVRIHYVAPNTEPIGRLQTDDPIVHQAIDGWTTMAADVGPYSAVELGGFPYDGVLWDLLDKLADDGVRIEGAQCDNAATLIDQLRDTLAGSRDALDEHLTLPPGVSTRARDALAALRNECMPGVTLTFVNALASMYETTPQEIASSMSPRDLQLVSNKHVVDALAALTIDRRSTMRTLERTLPQARPWLSARYFSTEEDADDVAVMVLRADGRNAQSYADAALSSVAKRGPEAAARCKALLDAGIVPPYGVDLLDAHHASCWRAYHALQIAKLPAQKTRVTQALRWTSSSLAGLPRAPLPELLIQE